MAQIKCDYCDAYIEDTMESCPHCGAPNENLKRTATGTPKTIEELKSWYIARKLPPEETTRFFIGKNISEPRAFGIYKDGNDFIVYKNKDDGSRAVRYRGHDEAYAVKELYLKLKEEILNQKNLNLASRSRGSSQSRGKRRPKGCLFGFLVPLIVVVIAIVTGIIGLTVENHRPQSYSYYQSASGVYYVEYQSGDDYKWWKFDIPEKEWYAYKDSPRKEFIDDVTWKDKTYATDIAYDLNLEYDDVNIYNSRNYIDSGHHYTPDEGYYTGEDGRLYYYLDDRYGESYGNGDNSGWYVYDNNDWIYYSAYDDRDTLGDAFWYRPDDYFTSWDYAGLGGYDYNSNMTWDSSADFSGTEWYDEAESASAAHSEWLEEQNKNSSSSSSSSSWDNDSDWDWDSSDSWDSGGTDWSSDW